MTAFTAHAEAAIFYSPENFIRLNNYSPKKSFIAP